MKPPTAACLMGMFALTACDEGTVTSQTAQSAGTPKQAGQLCALTAQQCQSFSAQSQALLPVLNKDAAGRSSTDDATVQLVLNTLLSQQAAADANCTPVSGPLDRMAKLVVENGQSASLLARGNSICTLVRES